jgi:hypothetical protein
MTLVIDEAGVYYRLPIAIINDPEEYQKDPNKEKLDNKKQPKEENRHLKLRSVKGDKEIDISNLTSIPDLKQKYLDILEDKETEPAKLRMFCMGKELKDEHFIYTYDIDNDMAVQVMFRK